jgi:hypothetical protein
MFHKKKLNMYLNQDKLKELNMMKLNTKFKDLKSNKSNKSNNTHTTNLKYLLLKLFNNNHFNHYTLPKFTTQLYNNQFNMFNNHTTNQFINHTTNQSTNQFMYLNTNQSTTFNHTNHNFNTMDKSINLISKKPE